LAQSVVDPEQDESKNWRESMKKSATKKAAKKKAAKKKKR